MIDVPAAAPAGPQVARARSPRHGGDADGLVSEGPSACLRSEAAGGFWAARGGGRKDDEDATAAPAVPSFGDELK